MHSARLGLCGFVPSMNCSGMIGGGPGGITCFLLSWSCWCPLGWGVAVDGIYGGWGYVVFFDVLVGLHNVFVHCHATV